MKNSESDSELNETVAAMSRYKLVVPVVTLGAIFVLMSCATTERSDGNYQPIEDLLPSDAYTAKPSGTSNEIRVSGNGKTAVFSAGIAGFSVDGEWHDLEDRPVYRDGTLHLSKADASSLRDALSGSSASKEPEKPEKTVRRDRSFTVVIDPGHGGKFVGARGVNGQLEKRLNLQVARYTNRYLNEDDINVRLTRSSDRSLSQNHKRDLDQRVQFAERTDADLFISIHANAARASSANGFELYISPREDRYETIQRLKSWYPNPSEASESQTHATGYHSYQQMYRDHRNKSQRLARLIHNRFRQVVPTGSRGIKKKSLHVLRNAPCPAVLVELGFMTNQREANLLSRSSYQRKLGKKLAQAVKSFRRSLAHRTQD